LVYHKGRTIYPAAKIFIDFIYRVSREIEQKIDCKEQYKT